jgi:hypothetical protein
VTAEPTYPIRPELTADLIAWWGPRSRARSAVPHPAGVRNEGAYSAIRLRGLAAARSAAGHANRETKRVRGCLACRRDTRNSVVVLRRAGPSWTGAPLAARVGRNPHPGPSAPGHRDKKTGPTPRGGRLDLARLLAEPGDLELTRTDYRRERSPGRGRP